MLQNGGESVRCDLSVIHRGNDSDVEVSSLDDVDRSLDIGDRFVIQPEFDWWGNGHLEGAALPEGFAYTSDRNDTWLARDGLRALLDHA